MSALLFSLFTLSQLVASGPLVRRSTLAAGCDPATRALSLGVQNNIAVQYQELSISTQLSNTLASNPVDVNTFQVQKAQLLFTVEQGIVIRQNNQNIPTSNQAVIQGLNNVANSQQLELLATQQLGNSDLIQTANTVNSLMAAFVDGVNQNTNTLAQVLSQCPGGPSNNGLGSAQQLQSIVQNNGNNQNNGNGLNSGNSLNSGSNLNNGNNQNNGNGLNSGSNLNNGNNNDNQNNGNNNQNNGNNNDNQNNGNNNQNNGNNNQNNGNNNDNQNNGNNNQNNGNNENNGIGSLNGTNSTMASPTSTSGNRNQNLPSPTGSSSNKNQNSSSSNGKSNNINEN